MRATSWGARRRPLGASRSSRLCRRPVLDWRQPGRRPDIPPAPRVAPRAPSGYLSAPFAVRPAPKHRRRSSGPLMAAPTTTTTTKTMAGRIVYLARRSPLGIGAQQPPGGICNRENAKQTNKPTDEGRLTPICAHISRGAFIEPAGSEQEEDGPVVDGAVAHLLSLCGRRRLGSRGIPRALQSGACRARPRPTRPRPNRPSADGRREASINPAERRRPRPLVWAPAHAPGPETTERVDLFICLASLAPHPAPDPMAGICRRGSFWRMSYDETRSPPPPNRWARAGDVRRPPRGLIAALAWQEAALAAG